jgi:putative protease
LEIQTRREYITSDERGAQSTGAKTPHPEISNAVKSSGKKTARPEILAPAGSPEALRAAVLCGADAVYLGGKMFSARANAANFGLDELEDAVRFSHLHGVKLYIAANTLLFNGELKEFAAFIGKAADLGVDAFIVADLGGAKIIRETVQSAVLHASTQMTVTDRGGAELLRGLGFSRVVAARELDRAALADLTAAGAEIEVFVHGALCMSVSGQCLMSAFIGGRSGNRGECAQSCRLPFCVGESFRTGENALSLKDLSLINHIKELSEIGVASLKIEGRMKRPEYVAAAVTALRAAISGENPDLETLRAVFSRSGFTDGYFTAEKKHMFGTRTKDDVIAAETILPEIRKTYADETSSIPINMDLKAKFGEPVLLGVWSEDDHLCVSAGSNPPERSVKIATTADDITIQLEKLGGTPFFANEITVTIDDGIYLPKSVINALRRIAVTGFGEAITEKNTPHLETRNYAPPALKTSEKSYPGKFVAEIFHKNQLESVPEITARGGKVVLPIELIDGIPQENYENIIISLPKHGNNLSKLSNLRASDFSGVCCQNISHIALANKYGFTKYGGIHLNVANNETVSFLRESGFAATVASVECKFREIEEMSKSDCPVGIYVYGKVPVMLCAVCPIKGGGDVCPHNCPKQLTDRTGRHFTVRCRKDAGYVELLNPETLSLEDDTDNIRADFLYLSFADETPPQIREIVDSFLNKTGKKRENITRGLYRGRRNAGKITEK